MLYRSTRMPTVDLCLSDLLAACQSSLDGANYQTVCQLPDIWQVYKIPCTLVHVHAVFIVFIVCILCMY